jgi:iron complex outermembrane recepter protein
VSTGFRAPSLQQSFFSSTATNFIGGIPFEIKTFPVQSLAARLLGAQDLKAEKSVNFSGGVAGEVRGLAVSIDYYQINIADRIVFSENFTTVAVRNFLAANGVPNVSGGRFFTNAIDTRTRGIDIVGQYGFDFERYGVLRLTAGYNGNKTKVTDLVVPTPPALGNLSETLFGRVERARIEEGQPRNNMLFSAIHDLKSWTFVLRAQRFGQVISRQAVANPQPPDQLFEPKVITDASVAFKLRERATLTVGSDNIFDVYPDENNARGSATANFAGNANFGIFPYNGISPFGFNGRFVYARVQFRL